MYYVEKVGPAEPEQMPATMNRVEVAV